MHSLVDVQTLRPQGSWAHALAQRELAMAIQLLEEAGVSMTALAEDADWQSKGVTALHELLVRMRDDTGSEIGSLMAREWEIAAEGAR
jgi:hypothetical protein